MGHSGGFQPYARGQNRPQTSALQAMVAGRAPALPNPQDMAGMVQSQGTEKALAPIRSRVLDEFIAIHARP